MSKLPIFSVLLIFCWAGINGSHGQFKSPLKIVSQWSQIQFVFPSESAKQKAIDNGYYIPDPAENFPIDVDVHYRANGERRIFITIPRFGKGRPITLGTVDREGRVHGYPDYSWNDDQGTTCEGKITSVLRTAIDKCGRLWVLDTGKIGSKWNCPPTLLAFDLNTDTLVFKHQLNKYANNALYVTPVVDIRSNDCSGTFVYLADVSGFGLSVVDVDNNRSWLVKHPLFYPYPEAGTFVIDGVRFQLMDGLLGLALSPLVNGDRILYFHALASVKESVVLTSTIRNSSFIGNPSADPDSIRELPNHRSNQSAAEAMDRNGILYFGIMNPPSIWCWNSRTEFAQRNFHPIAINERTLQFASGLKVITNHKNQDEIWVMATALQRSMAGTLNDKQINFRIHAGSLTQILKRSPCFYPQIRGTKY